MGLWRQLLLRPLLILPPSPRRFLCRLVCALGPSLGHTEAGATVSICRVAVVASLIVRLHAIAAFVDALLLLPRALFQRILAALARQTLALLGVWLIPPKLTWLAGLKVIYVGGGGGA
jgi:hypothetical protein